MLRSLSKAIQQKVIDQLMPEQSTALTKMLYACSEPVTKTCVFDDAYSVGAPSGDKNWKAPEQAVTSRGAIRRPSTLASQPPASKAGHTVPQDLLSWAAQRAADDHEG